MSFHNRPRNPRPPGPSRAKPSDRRSATSPTRPPLRVENGGASGKAVAPRRGHREPPNLVWSRGEFAADERATASALRRETALSKARRRNRRRRNQVRLALRLSLFVLAVEVLIVLFFSPHFRIRQVRVEGNDGVRAERVVERMAIQPRTALVRAPVSAMRTRVVAEPAIADASVHRRLPGTLIVRVTERAPTATLQIGSIWYTVDEDFVPFVQRRTPMPELPQVVIEGMDDAEPKLGKQLVAVHAQAVNICLNWADENPEFPLEKVRVDQTAKLCLNRVGGGEVQLGSPVDLEQKLNSLSLLLDYRPELRAGNFQYINLYAYDAPAVRPRSGSSATTTHPVIDAAGG